MTLIIDPILSLRPQKATLDQVSQLPARAPHLLNGKWQYLLSSVGHLCRYPQISTLLLRFQGWQAATVLTDLLPTSETAFLLSYSPLFLWW